MVFNLDEAKNFPFSSKDNFFLGSEAGKVFSRGMTNRGVEVFPGIRSDDPLFLMFTSRLSEQLNDRFSKKVLDDGFFDKSAVSSNFFELNTVAGYYMDPATYTVVGNKRLRDEMGLSHNFKSVRHEKIFEELIKLRYAEHNGERAKISKISNSGFPRFSKSVSYKVEHLNYLVSKRDIIRDKFNKNEFDSLCKNFGMVFGKNSVYRGQADSVSQSNGRLLSKPREVNDLEYALSGGASGKRFIADKSVIVNGSLLDQKFGMRKRTANGMAIPVNLWCSTFFEGYRNYADNTYGMTFKHKTRESIEDKIKQHKYVFAMDVTQYDQSVPEWLFDKWLSILPGNDFFKDYVRTLSKCPMYYGGVGQRGEPIWTGNPLDHRYHDQWTGLVSGIFYTSAAGKDFFTWAVLCIIDDFYHDVLGNVDRILKWEDDRYSISNMGDDTLLHTSDLEFFNYLDLVNETSSFGLSPYFKVDKEDGLRFVGNVGYKTENNEIKLCGDIASYFKNMLVPERGLDSRHREFGVYGLLERRNVFMDNPSFGEADEIFMKLFRGVFGINFIQLLTDNMVMPSMILTGVTKQSDLEVLLDPSKLHYKYDTEDISSAIVGMIEEKVSVENTDLLYNFFTK